MAKELQISVSDWYHSTVNGYHIDSFVCARTSGLRAADADDAHELSSTSSRFARKPELPLLGSATVNNLPSQSGFCDE